MEELIWPLISFVYSNIWSVMKYSSYSIITFLLCIVIKVFLYEISYYIEIKKWTNVPGVAVYYAPFQGFVKLAFNWNGVDRAIGWSEEFQKHSDAKVLVTNFPGQKFGTICAYLVSSDAVKDFIYKDTTNAEKNLKWSDLQGFDVGFLSTNGKKGLDYRAVFSEFFVYDRLNTLYGPMYEIIDNHCKNLIQSKNLTNTEFKKIDVKEFFFGVMLDWVTQFLFGCKPGEDLNVDLTNHPDITNGEYHITSLKNKKSINLVELATFYSEETFNYFRDILNRSLNGIPYALGLRKIYRDHKALKAFVYNEIKKVYQKRYDDSESSQPRITNVLSMVVKHNQQCLKDKNHKDQLPEDIIINSLIGFLFAGYDTSVNASTSGIMHMSQKHQNWLTKIYDEGVKNIDEIKKNNSMELVIKEVQRLYNPAQCTFPRIQIKDTEVHGIKIPKGTRIGIPVGFNRWNDRFIDSHEFRPERFESEIPKLPKFAYIPFYDGKRKCLGYELGLTNIRIFLGYMINKFELNVDEKYQLIMDGVGIYGCSNPILEVKLR